MSGHGRVSVEGRAAGLLELMQDLGHLDDTAVSRLLLGAAEPGVGRNAVLVSSEVRRAAAAHLFDLRPDAPVVQDWRLLFS